MQLLKSQKAALYEILQREGFEPGCFSWGKGPNNAEVLFAHSTDFSFSIRSVERRVVTTSDVDVFAVVFSPGRERMLESDTAEDWSDSCRLFRIWCSCLRREISTQDPWEELERRAVALDFRPAETESDQPFSVGEFEKVQAGLALLRAEMIEMAGGNRQYGERIEAGINGLVQTARTEGRRSFFISCATFVFSSALSMALAPEQTRQLFQTLRTGLMSVIRFLG